MKTYNDELDSWLDISMLGGILISVGLCLLVAEIFRLPGRAWRAIK